MRRWAGELPELGALRPARYGSADSAEWTSMIQLWSLTSLAVEDALEKARAAEMP